MTHVVSTIRGGKVWSMDWWFSENTQLQMTISMERNAIKYSPKWMGVVYFLPIIYGSKLQRSRWSKDFCNTWSFCRKSQVLNWWLVKEGIIQKTYNLGLCTNLHLQIIINHWKNGRWKKTPISMCLRRLRKTT